MFPPLSSARSGTGQACLLSIFLFHSHGGSKHINQARERNLKHSHSEERSKITLFANNIILYTGIIKKFTKNLLE